jgi:hypothetical protein
MYTVGEVSRRPTSRREAPICHEALQTDIFTQHPINCFSAMHTFLLTLLLLPPCPHTTPSHAKALAIQALKHLKDSLATGVSGFTNPAFYKIYPFSRQQLAFYGGKAYKPASGYLVIYTVQQRHGPDGILPRAIPVKKALFVSNCDSVMYFKPAGSNMEFSDVYGVP